MTQNISLTGCYQNSTLLERLRSLLEHSGARVHVDGMTGSMPAAVIAAYTQACPTVSHLAIAPNREEAYYLANDLEALTDHTSPRAEDLENQNTKIKVLFFPTSTRAAHDRAANRQTMPMCCNAPRWSKNWAAAARASW